MGLDAHIFWTCNGSIFWRKSKKRNAKRTEYQHGVQRGSNRGKKRRQRKGPYCAILHTGAGRCSVGENIHKHQGGELTPPLETEIENHIHTECYVTTLGMFSAGGARSASHSLATSLGTHRRLSKNSRETTQDVCTRKGEEN